jgi:two-component system cell cycle sensor histidine kinase PleC
MRAHHARPRRREIHHLTVEGDELPEIADPRALKQVLLNLMSNAVKFTPEGGKVIQCAPSTRRTAS